MELPETPPSLLVQGAGVNKSQNRRRCGNRDRSDQTKLVSFLSDFSRVGLGAAGLGEWGYCRPRTSSGRLTHVSKASITILGIVTDVY